eukprot:CAMPEP_0203763912 /NCGR_PEP_ID=MMETSP0098-20131031/17091_1 /ASSEMBLY_ACC=CAM_ASM_000208 /TAXON_ID=96639 /ORGANISM=" , Strain NY0313808BC1" /LENGTH=140 /DNA_ID=CAMNT_0050659293 /DNA_START=59 /DNA_END=478 /DNA_ORIENTATION=+
MSIVLTALTAAALTRTVSMRTQPFVLLMVKSADPPPAPVWVIACAPVFVSESVLLMARVVTADTAAPVNTTLSIATVPDPETIVSDVEPECEIVAAFLDMVRSSVIAIVDAALIAAPLKRTDSIKTHPFVLLTVKSADPP